MKRQECPCCGYFTVESEDEVIVDICPVCFWQYDLVAHEKPDKNIGANHVSLNEARQNYKKYGVCKKRHIGKNFTRLPLPEELPENN